MPVQTIGNISLADSAAAHHGQAHERVLKGGLGDRTPGNLIEEWPIPADTSDESSTLTITSAIERQIQDRPWLMLAGAAVLGVVLGRLCIRR